MDGPRFTYATEVEFGGDTPTACCEVEIGYAVNWGRLARTYGRPEDCYMGDPDEIGWAKVLRINGKPRPWPHIHGGCCARGGVAALRNAAKRAEAAEEGA